MSTAVNSGTNQNHHHHHHHSGAGTLSLMSCVRESSPPQDGGNELEPEKIVSNKRKFWNPRKWFKRKSNKVAEECQPTNEPEQQCRETTRSRSTSELSISEEHQSRRRSGTPMHPGLSVSHDSVFHSPHSGSELELETAQSSSSLSIMGHHPAQPDIRLQTELSERLRQRRQREDTSEDDEGLPRSPCNSPTTTEGLPDRNTTNKDLPTKSHSTCSDGSLLSMASSEMEEDSFDMHIRQISTKQSPQEKSQDVTDADATEWGLGKPSAPLNHSAAHHKVSIRPKRTHGAPRKIRAPPAVLPTTPEVNEESSLRSLTPDASNARENVTKLYASLSYEIEQQSVDSKTKCSSLPPGLAGPAGLLDGCKLMRSRSNAGNSGDKQHDSFWEEDESLGEDKKSSDGSFLSRWFPRRSAKKQKKVKEEELEEQRVVVTNNSDVLRVSSKTVVADPYDPFDHNMITVDSNLAIRPNALRTTSSRQRIEPLNFPISLETVKMSTDESFLSMNENDYEDSLIIDKRVSPNFSKLNRTSPMIPPKSPWNEKRQHYLKYSSSRLPPSSPTKNESISIVRIARLSSLQQRVLSLQDEPDVAPENFKSLTNLSPDCDQIVKPVAKSHSFKTANISTGDNGMSNSCSTKTDSNNIFKSMSLDSLKTNANDKIVESVNPAKIAENKLNDDENDAKPMDCDQMQDQVIICGPSHKAIVNVSSLGPTFQNDQRRNSKEQVSVTKIQVNESPKIFVYGKADIFNFEQKNNSLDQKKPDSPEAIKLDSPATPQEEPSIDSKERKTSPSSEDAEKVKVTRSFIPVRKFSNDNIEVIKKEDVVKKEIVDLPLKPVTPKAAFQLRKLSGSLADRQTPQKLGALDVDSKTKSLDSISMSSQNSLDNIEIGRSQENIAENVVRRRSVVRHKQDDEPELMKVFARRSLKLKDSDVESLSEQMLIMSQTEAKKEIKESNDTKSRDSDKENVSSESSPIEERKKSLSLIPKSTTILIDNKSQQEDVVLRKSSVNNGGNKLNVHHRCAIVSVAKPESKVLKQITLLDKPKTDSWIVNNNTDDEKIRKMSEMVKDNSESSNTSSPEIIECLSGKSPINNELIPETKNFNQRKAEWEKRAQEALRNTMP